MTANDEHLPGTDRDSELARRFAGMRQQERASAPAFPAPAQLRQRQPLAQSRAVPARFTQMAAVIALLAIGIGLFSYQPQEDPAAIYASIMDAQPVATDQLLVVSESVLPGMSTVPGLEEIDLQFEQDYYIN